MTLLERVKVRLGIADTSKDDLLSELIMSAKEYVVTFCNRAGMEDIPASLDGIIIKMVVIDYNKIGSEGLKSESYAGASYNYSDDYPDDIKKALYHERLLRAW